MADRHTWTLKRTVHDTAHPRDGEPYAYSYNVPRTVRIPGLVTAHGQLVLDTEHLVFGAQIWLRDDDDGMAGFRVGIGPLQWEVLCARLYTRRAVIRRRARDLVAETEKYLADDRSTP